MERYIAHILPKGNIQDDGVEIPLGDKWDEYSASIADYVATVRPSMLVEHEPDGYSHGEILGTFITPQGIFIEFIPGEDIEMEKTRWVSPRIRWHHTDVHGKYWPAALLETSYVSVPRFLPGQEEIVPKSQWNPPLESRFSAIVSPSKGEIMTPEMLAEVQKLIAEGVAAAMAAAAPAPVVEEEVTMEEGLLEEVVEEVEAPAAMTVEALMSMDPAGLGAALDPLPIEEKADLLMKLSEELLKVKEETVMSAIKSKIASRAIPASAHSGLTKLARTDAKAFESALSAFPVAAKRTTPVANSGSNTDFSGRVKRAEAYAISNNVSLAEAFNKI